MSKAFSFYFPQFCRESLNNEAWYDGFNDWDLIKGLVIRKGIETRKFCPKVGFYDQDLLEVIENQVAEAIDTGIDGFCAYHYWFDGTIALENPICHLRNVANQKNFPYFLCWANESWTKRWVGRNEDVIIEQQYGDDTQKIQHHVDYLCSHFSTNAYYRIDGRPVFAVYSPYSEKLLKILPLYKFLFNKIGMNPFFVAVESSYITTPCPNNFYDMVLRFEPRSYFSFLRQKTLGRHELLIKKIVEKFPIIHNFISKYVVDQKKEHSYEDYSNYLQISLENLAQRRLLGEIVATSFNADWDNSPRYVDRATSFTGVRPDLVARNLKLVQRWSNSASSPFYVFNAWNEWSEGAVLEERQAQAYSLKALFKDHLPYS